MLEVFKKSFFIKYLRNNLKILNFLFNFVKDYNKLKKNSEKSKFLLSVDNFQICIFDKTNYTPFESVYFFQDIWFAKKIFKSKQEYHYDVGSSVKTLSIISQFIPVTTVDIRPIEVTVDNLHFIKGSILDLPFKNDSINSLSSLCVIEHIGLGRYGDKIDPDGSEKAIKELKRVLKPNGNLYISLPIDSNNQIYFNAHRTFTKEYVMELFNDLLLKDEKYIYGKTVYDNYKKEKGFGTGLYHFIKK